MILKGLIRQVLITLSPSHNDAYTASEYKLQALLEDSKKELKDLRWA